MARIEKGQPAKQEIEQLKAQVVNEVRRVRRRKVPLLAIVSLLLVVSGVVWCLWIVAASGLVSVPLVSRYAYPKAPEVTREVAPGDEPLETVITEAVSALLPERLQAGSGQLSDRSFDLALSERAFTASLQAALKQDPNTMFDTSRAQVAVLEGQGLEIFLPLAQSAQETALVVVLSLRIQDGHVVFDLSRVQLGQLVLPAWLSDFVIAAPIEQGIAAFEDDVQRIVVISTLREENGSLRLIGELQVEVMQIPTFQ